MNPIYVRPLRGDDADRAAFVAAVENSGRSFPKNVFTLPSTRVMVAEKLEEHGPEIVLYQPFYVSLVMGSYVGLGTDNEIASALHQMTAHAYTRANGEGLAEILAFTHTGATEGFAKRHRFVEAHQAYRLDVR